MKKTILGLDLGTSSVGWCLIDVDPTPQSIIDMGVRIFPERVNRSKGGKSLNQERREARSLRRQGYRRVRRKQKLLHALQDSRLLPKKPVELAEVFQLDPYALRAQALDKPLSAYYLGRALYHLGQRRGYLSNRKVGDDKEDGAVSSGIGEIDTAMREGRHRSLGEYFYSLDPHKTRIRGNYTARRMYEKEFDEIWLAQETHHLKAMTPTSRKRIRAAIFDQRPLKIQKHLIGSCEFTQRKRAAAATLAAQEFRLWQNLNNLKVIFADGKERFLTDKERLILHSKLGTSKQMSWEKVKKALSFPDKSSHLNLEQVRKSGLLGNQTAAMLSSALTKKTWQSLSDRQKEDLVSDLINIAEEQPLKNRLRKYWRFEESTIDKLLNLRLPKGYMHLSHKAIRDILLFLSEVSTPENRGYTYNQACERAGYMHTKPEPEKCFDALPFPGKAARRKEKKDGTVINPANHADDLTDGPMCIGDLRNPMVERALYQVRKVVNAIIKTYGKPDIIRVEMARDLKANAKQRAEDDQRNKENEKKNKIAEERLGEYGLNPTRNDIIKYKLWEECEHLCPYTGKTISMDALFGDSPRFDIEHIIPYSRSLDDSFMNKTLCEKGENERKANHTPYEHYSGNQVIYGEILARVKKLPYPKRKRFTMENLDDVDFVSQQLNETRYIARQTVTFLGQLGVNVQPVKGGTTALLRRAWALNGILSNDGEKTREDHRHHAIDALVVALTDRRAVQRLSRYHTLSYRGLRIENYPEPITDLRQHATKAVGKITVSHKTNRKVQGALHKEFLYGLTGNTDTKGVPEVVIRKPLVELKEQKGLHHIRDPKIRQMALEHFARSQNFKDAFANPENPFGFRDKQGRVTRPIKKVRLVYQRTIATIGSNDESIRHQRNVWTRNNHHIEIIEFTDVKGRLKWRGEVVNMLEAATRKRHGQPVVTIQHGKDERFVMTVHKEDVFSLNHQGQALICRVQKFDQNGLIALRTHTDASQDSQKFIYKTPETLRQSGARLLMISPLGKVATPHE